MLARLKVTLLAAALVLAPAQLLGKDSHSKHAHESKHSKDKSDKGTFRNYGVVWPGMLTRSGVPSSDSGWEWLRQEGVKSIVTFLDDDEVDYEKYEFEHVLTIPLDGEDVPSDAQTKKFLAFVQEPNHWPVHMHCHAGKDRTGMMAAMVRYAIDGWTLERALAEARPYRGGKDLSDFRIEWLERWAAHHEPGSEKVLRQ